MRSLFRYVEIVSFFVVTERFFVSAVHGTWPMLDKQSPWRSAIQPGVIPSSLMLHKSIFDTLSK